MSNRSKPDNIVFAIPSLSAGGMERVMTELANFFALNPDLQIHLVLYGDNSRQFFPLNENVRVHKIGGSIYCNNRFCNFFRSANYLRRRINAIRPEAVLSFGIHWNVFVLLALAGTGFKIVVSDRGSAERKYSFYIEYLKNILYPRAKAIVVQSELAEHATRLRFPSQRIERIGNPISAFPFSDEFRKEEIILSVGRLITTKHHERLIRIFNRLNAPNWKLVIVGGDISGGNNFSRLLGLIRELNLTERVFLEGERTDVFDYYLKSRIFAFTSSVEGFPNVLGEALSIGLPVVSYNCISGPAELIRHGENGYLIEVFDDEEFRNKLQYLIDNPKLAKEISVNAKQSIKEFSLEKIGEKFLNTLLN